MQCKSNLTSSSPNSAQDSWAVSVDPSQSVQDRIETIKTNMERIDQQLAQLDISRSPDTEEFKANLLAHKAGAQVLLWKQHYQDRVERPTRPSSVEESQPGLVALSVADPTDTEQSYEARVRTQQLREKSFLLEACILYQQVRESSTLRGRNN